MELPGGLQLRAARPDDLDQIGALLADRGDAADPQDHRLVVEDPDGGFDACGVVVHGDRVVSTATLLDETVVLAGLPIPAGQVELVATDRAYEGRGLVRALMGWAHERSARRGHLMQVMIGIPYFYRQFGYQYAIPIPQGRAVRSVPAMPDGCTVRAAGPGDIAAMARLQDALQVRFDVRMPHSPVCWRALVARAGSTQLVVERAGQVTGTGRVTPPEEGVVLGEVAVSRPEAVAALLAHAAELAGGKQFEAKDRAGLLTDHLAAPDPQAHDYYLRIPDVAALLEHLRPVLSARLAHDQGDDDVIVSFFRHHVRLRRAAGAVTEVVAGGPMQGPASQGGAGVAPDLIGPLLFGPHGIAGLSAWHADVYPGPNAELMRALFPPVTADLLTFYLP
ncbi:GNAT family N-acetyltransferase [Dactylosporangium sp. NBC_01737]|uniref:GNAT family N-acetyltransferase n=1 Tax=Dactylosporangium sp. NBC_01737 TaxID=2975959 RepID=UPI002E138E73|nr:GNAT family N-acetyltransferase [Dactylosporangium sp. NBC_01737]